MRICVVGAGIIGVTTAYSLAKRGHDVTVIESSDKSGQETSYANGGQLSYSYVAPLADPTIWKNLPRYLLHPHSPLTLRPTFDVAQWQWCLKFLAACNANAAAHATTALVRLAFFSKDCLTSLQKELPLDFDFREAGKLVMFSTNAGLEAARRQVQFQQTLGCEQDVLDIAQCVEIEPTLASSIKRWTGGVYTPSEQVGDCAEFCERLASALSQSYGRMQFMFNTCVTGTVVERGRVTALLTSAGDINADLFVLANGNGSAKLASTMGFKLPIYPLKGYSVTLNTARECDVPSISITDYAKKVVYARLGNRLRVAGRLEIVGHDVSIDQKKCQSLADQARDLFPGLSSGDQDILPWTGNRPATPTGIPIIGRSPLSNVFLNTGHGAFGWTLACGSAELLAMQIEGQKGPMDGRTFAYQS